MRDRPSKLRIEPAHAERMQSILDFYAKDLPKPLKTKGPLKYARKTIAIIGSTGYLGPYIVASLLKHDNGSNIFCLNRNDEGGERTKAALLKIVGLESSDLRRLVFFRADLEQLNFGLEAEPIAFLRDRVDELVFNAWDTNWIKALDQFHPFLMGIRQSIIFCTAAKRRFRLTFISSICAVADWTLGHLQEKRVPEEVLQGQGTAMPHGYGQSKWIAERLLSSGNAGSGIAVNIVRAGQIGGPQDPSVGTWPVQPWLWSIITTSRRLRYFPNNVQALNWIPVDDFAKGVASCVSIAPRLRSVRVFNMVHPHPIPWSILHRTLQLHYGLTAALVDLPYWLACLDPDELKIHSLFTTRKGGREKSMVFENENALDVLPPVQPLSRGILVTWLASWGLRMDTASARM